MIKISKEQALRRWGTLPDNLREAVLSAYNAEVLWRVCENQHLSEDKIEKVAIAAGDVLMGFVHPEGFASEIREALNINAEIANAIAAEIDRKIFFPLKEELEKVYQPSPPETEKAEEEQESPVLNLKKKMEEFSFKIVEDENQKQENKIDLSKEIKKENVAAPQAEPIIEEKEEKKPEEPKVENGPLIIHQEIGFKPFSGKLKSLGGMFNFLRNKDEFRKENEPVKAELEIGEEFKITEDKKEEYKPEIKTEEPVKVINYSEMPEQLISENLPVTKENLKEIEPELEQEKKIEEKKPETEKKGESEETIDLGMFK